MKYGDYITSEIWNVLSKNDREKLLHYFQFIGYKTESISLEDRFNHEVIIVSRRKLNVWFLFLINEYHYKLSLEEVHHIIELSPL